jgi:hypothetical protein
MGTESARLNGCCKCGRYDVREKRESRGRLPEIDIFHVSPTITANRFHFIVQIHFLECRKRGLKKFVHLSDLRDRQSRGCIFFLTSLTKKAYLSEKARRDWATTDR